MIRYTARPHHRYSRCSHSHKQRFRSRHDAKLVLGQIKRLHAKAVQLGYASHRHEQREYKCPYCSGWHLTSKPMLY